MIFYILSLVGLSSSISLDFGNETNHSATIVSVVLEPNTPVSPDTGSPTGAAFALFSAVFSIFVTLLYSQWARISSYSSVTVEYWRCLFYFWNNGDYASCPYFKDNLHAKVQVHSLALINFMWHKPHYRNGSFGDDMRKNLRNVAFPRTGVPLSMLCYSSIFKLVLVFLNPIVSFVAAYMSMGKNDSLLRVYKEYLLNPTDWFSLWRLNCRLASYHALKTSDEGFRMEDKWTFLVEGEKQGVAVSPVLDIGNIVCKDKNEEGGMGIHFFSNASNNGDWIIQKALKNNEFVSSLLPSQAPLSTIRIVTASRKTFDKDSDIQPLSCVFRAGRKGAATDHDAILFDIDLATGVIGNGSINKKWYQVGFSKIGQKPVAEELFTSHPDCGVKVTGIQVPDFDKVVALCTSAHLKTCPNVPLCGWDVAMTTDGMFLLEVNLSCNFFQASVDYAHYVQFVDEHFKHLACM